MYNNFFGFTEKPFDLTPNPKFLYLNPPYQEILASLIYGINERRGFITLIGEAGTGKTTLLNAVIEKLPSSTKVAFIFNTNLTFKQMLLLAMVDLGIIRYQKNLQSSQALFLFNEFAVSQSEAGGNVVLMVDEAQNLKHSTLENLRLLSNLETPKHKLIQIILCGQLGLDTKLNHAKLNQLAQRISLRRFSMPLNEKETYAYIKHRLKIANYKGKKLFDSDSLKLIWEYSQGIPRKINILCDNALLIAYALENKQINQRVVKEVIRDLSYHPFEKARHDGFEFSLEKASLI